MAVMATIPAVYSSNRLSPMPMKATTFKIPRPMMEAEPVVSISFVMNSSFS